MATGTSRQIQIIVHIVLSVLLVLGSPYIALGYLFGIAAGGNLRSMGNTQDYIQLMFLATFLLYFVFFNLYGWFAISNREPFGIKMFVYPFLAWLMIFLVHII